MIEENIEQVKPLGGFLLILTSQEDKYKLTLTNRKEFELELSPKQRLSKIEYLGLIDCINSTDSFLKLANYYRKEYRKEEQFDA